jgi:hypothetical protein
MAQLIQHPSKYFRDFDRAPKILELYEIHDVKFLKELLEEDENVKNNYNAKKRIISYINATTTPFKGLRKRAVKITYFKYWKSGKYGTKNTLQYMDRSIKEKIYGHDGYVSLDIVNRGYSIIHEIAECHGINLPAIKYFVQNREQVYQDHFAYWTHLKEISDVKCIFLQFIEAFTDYGCGTPFCKDIIDELIYADEIFRHPKYPHLNLEKIIEVYSTFIMKLIVEFLVTNEIMEENYYSLNGDEIFFQPLKSFDILDVEDYIYRHTGFNIRLH